MAKPKLLVLASTFPKSPGDGTPGFVLDLALEQAKDFETVVLTPFVSGAKRTEMVGEVRVIRYRYWPFAHRLADGAILDNLRSNSASWLEVPFLFLGLCFALVRQLWSFNPNLIHSHWIIPQGLVAALSKGKTPMLITVHGGDIYALNGGSLKDLKIWALGRAAAITTVNSDMKQKLIEWGISESKIHVQPMGVRLSSFSLAADREPELFVSVGRLVEKKGFGPLIDAIAKGIESGAISQTARFVVAGDGPLKAELAARAKGLPIEFLGQVNQREVAQLLSKAAGFILPSVIAESGDREGLPVTLLEAAAAGCFVIASELPGITEVVQHKSTGLLVPPGDVSALAGAIALGLEDEKLRETCAAGVQKRVESFSLEAVGDAYRKILGGLI